MMRMECRRNASVISNYGLEIRDKKYTIITTNRPIAEWGLVLGDPMAATAIIDRLMHYCTAIAINGDSYRLKEHKLNKLLNQ